MFYFLGEGVTDDAITSLDAKPLALNRIDELAKLHRLPAVIHGALRITRTNSNFSPIYERWLSQRTESRGRIFGLVMRILKLLPGKLPNAEVNSFLHKLIKRNLENPFPTDKLVYFTPTAHPYLLCAKDLKVYTVLESWDHPGKAPMGHRSERVFLWNKPLTEDWLFYQGEDAVSYTYPVKLDYVIQHALTYDIRPRTTGRIMYAMTFGETSERSMYEEELHFLHKLCEATKTTGKTLFIKPKPNSKPGELDGFCSFEHVEIAVYQESGGGSNYDLNEEYNSLRLKELGTCELVYNVGTTFAMDAAMYGIPVVQLKFECPDTYPRLSSLAVFPHLSRHIYNMVPREFVITDLPIDKFLSTLCNPDVYSKPAVLYSEYLRKWLQPTKTKKLLIASALDEILA